MAAAHEEGCVTAKRATRAAEQLEGMHKRWAHKPAEMRDTQTTPLADQVALALQLMGRRAAI